MMTTLESVLGPIMEDLRKPVDLAPMGELKTITIFPDGAVRVQYNWRALNFGTIAELDRWYKLGLDHKGIESRAARVYAQLGLPVPEAVTEEMISAAEYLLKGRNEKL